MGRSEAHYLFVSWNQHNYERDHNRVDHLSGQRPSRLAEELLEQALDGVVPGEGRHETEGSGYQLDELV